MDAIRAGLAALAGDRATAQAGLRDVRSRYHDLGLLWDVAFIAIIAAALLDSADPEVAGWISDARATFERLKARPFVALLDGLAGRTPALGTGGNGTGAEAGAATAPAVDQVDQAERVSST